MQKRTRNNLLFILLLLIISAAAVGYYFYNKGPVDVKHSPAEKTEAPELYRQFSSDTVAASKKYAGKIILVTGDIASLSLNQQQQQVILLKTGTEGAYVNCTMEENPVNVKPNDKVNIKGICSGMGQGDADLGIMGDVYLGRCFLIK